MAREANTNRPVKKISSASMYKSLTQEKYIGSGDCEYQVASSANVDQFSNYALGLGPKQVIERYQRDRASQDSSEPGRGC